MKLISRAHKIPTLESHFLLVTTPNYPTFFALPTFTHGRTLDLTAPISNTPYFAIIINN
jgi:hypothetical protein